MSLLNNIKNFPKQFEWDPEIINVKDLFYNNNVIFAGMGGSGLAGELVKALKPGLNIISHRDYGLPSLNKDVLEKFLVVCSSYSGNTEEVLNSYETARERMIPVAVIASGGKLLEYAKKDEVPYVELPEKNMPPRMALGYSVVAFLSILGEKEIISELKGSVSAFEHDNLKAMGEELAEDLYGRIPVIYSSSRNSSLAYNWKIRFNETGKTPAFYNSFPELNHNEMEGFIDSSERYEKAAFSFIFLKDASDHERIIKRMEILSFMYRKCGFNVKEIPLREENAGLKIISAISLADWISYHLATKAKVDPESIPAIEDFKKAI